MYIEHREDNVYIREEKLLPVFLETSSDLSASHLRMRGAPPDASR